MFIYILSIIKALLTPSSNIFGGGPWSQSGNKVIRVHPVSPPVPAFLGFSSRVGISQHYPPTGRRLSFSPI